MPDQLDQPRAPAAKGEYRTIERIHPQRLLHQHRQPHHALALFLAVKVMCAIAGYQAGHMAPSTATFMFRAAQPIVVVTVRELCGYQHHAQLEE